MRITANPALKRWLLSPSRPTPLQQFLARFPRQALHHELVRVVDHFSQLDVRDAAFDLHCVPVFLVHVITGRDLFVAVAQLQGEVGITFQIRCRRNFVEGSKRKYFTADFEDEDIRSERRTLGRFRFAQAIFAKFREIHQEVRETRMLGRSLIATRSCFIESRTRASFSPSVSKSTVTPNGVPISS